MRKILLFFAFVLTAIGVKAYELDLTKTWTVDGVTEKVAKINLQSAGELTAALDDLNGQMTDYSHLYISNGAGFDLTTEDIAALGTVTCSTLDLQNLYGADGNHYAPFTFSNASIKRVILPDYWDKTAVKAAAQAIAAVNTNFEAALSQHGQQNQSTADAKLVAYVQKPGTLYTAMRHTYFDGRADKKMGNATQSYCSFEMLGYVSIMGYPSARDFNGSNSTDVKFDANGHFVFDRPADETSVTQNMGVGGVLRTLVGSPVNGALVGASPILLDLEDAIIYDEWNEDLNLSWSYLLGANRIKEVRIPTNPELKTIPADFLNSGGNVNYIEEFCIPGNIEIIRTRAFYSSQQVLRHVWTTGTTSHMIYDHGAYLHSDKEDVANYVDGNVPIDHLGHAPLDDTRWNCGKGTQEPARYGTITLPENLKLIESNCFSCRSVSDVYVLAKVAPECHVDAFSSIMYLGNNTIDTQYTKDQGMITRWSYAQGDADAEYISFLHYPRECGTPDIQRYTDPTREYSVATTMRDGKGNVIYFPNQAEMNRAYYQGTTGYLWFAWDSKRIPDNGNNGDANGFKNVNIQSHYGHTTENQQMGNDFYERNNMTNPDKTDRSFYDVRLDANGEPTLGQPEDLDWYYNTIWEGKQLYPQPETEGIVDGEGNPVMETVPVRDENGDIIYDELPSGSSYEGNYTRATEQKYVKASDGAYCHQLIQDGNGQWTIDYSYTENANGAWVKAPWDQSGKTWTQYADYMANQYPGIKRYDRAASELVEFDNQAHNDGRPRFNISTDYVEYDSYNHEYKNLLTRYNVKNVFVYSPAQSGDPEPYYKMQTQVVQAQNVIAQHDYRGWHQFILHAYSTMDDRPITPVKFYQTDSDWWTVCLPYDLRYSDMIRFFGNETTGAIPYLSKLRYVVRDYDKEKITLMFSKNLMVYKEAINNPSNTDDYVHGIIDDETKWPATENGVALGTPPTDEEGTDGYDPIILHKGVPYLIKPNIPTNANRSFDVYKNNHEKANPNLYKRLVDAQNVPAAQLETYIYKGEYTVPAYVIGENAPEATQDSRDFTHTFGPTFTYNSSDQITYGGKKVNAKVSKDFSYTFVGSFFLSIMPQNCYFLGWDSKNKCAAFWYNKVTKLDEYSWNNQTGVICANFDTSTAIDPATGLNDPAKWYIPSVASDDLKVSTGGNAKAYGMDWGGSVDVVVSGIGKINVDNTQSKAVSNDVIYDMRGVRMNRPLSRLTKGVYIVNGKKYVVD